MEMFDEKSPIWVKIYKVLVIVSTVAILIVGFILAKDQATHLYSKRTLDFWEFLLYFLIAIICAAANYVIGMLATNFLCNVQTIREKVEEMASRERKAVISEKNDRASGEGNAARPTTPTDAAKPVMTETGPFSLSDYM